MVAYAYNASLQKQEDCQEFKATLGDSMKHCFK